MKSANKTTIEIEPQLEEPQSKSNPEPTVAEIMAAAATAAETEAAKAKPLSAEEKLSRERDFASGAPHIPPKTKDESASKEEAKQEAKQEEKKEEKAEPKKKGGFFKRLFG